MKRSDIPTVQVLNACAQAYSGEYAERRMPWVLLRDWTGAPLKVIYAAIQREVDRGRLDYGVSLRTAFLTEAGRVYLTAHYQRFYEERINYYRKYFQRQSEVAQHRETA